MTAEGGSKLAAIAAARSAAKAAYLDTPVKRPKSLGARPDSRFKWPFKRTKDKLPEAPQIHAAPLQAPPAPPPLPVPEVKAAIPAMPAPMSVPMPPDDIADAPLSRGRQILKILKTLLVAASVAIIVVGTAQTAIELLFPAKPAAPDTQPADKPEKPAAGMPPATTPSRPMPMPMPTPEGSLPAPVPMPPAAEGEPTHSIGKSMFDPSTIIKLPDVTGSIPRKPAPPRTPAGNHIASDTLPASISPVLRTAVLASNPAAEYELGVRYAEGRNVPQNSPEAAVWLQRSADSGFAPAQFRLASLYEKGEGLKKDVQAARRLYLDAAQKGHAKAMHNLAVLYAEGIDGKPDYKSAVEWFRRAASYGVADSQYNLAILYARGIGVQANLAESYRWFALAAAKGDQDAARKRDEVAARLDQKTITAAKLAAQTFVADPEPDEATNLKVPPGGWDHLPAQPVKPRRQNPGPSAAH
jgi:localization factor PodJL